MKNTTQKPWFSVGDSHRCFTALLGFGARPNNSEHKTAPSSPTEVGKSGKSGSRPARKINTLGMNSDDGTIKLGLFSDNPIFYRWDAVTKKSSCPFCCGSIGASCAPDLDDLCSPKIGKA